MARLTKKQPVNAMKTLGSQIKALLNVSIVKSSASSELLTILSSMK
jgi:hypothetical protein